MTKEDKELLLKDLCARLPYGVKVNFPLWDRSDINTVITMFGEEIKVKELLTLDDVTPYLYNNVEPPKPYLHPMSSMTEEDAKSMFNAMYDFKVFTVEIEEDRARYTCKNGSYGHIVLFFNEIYSLKQLDWLNANHFDYRGLIPKGLAIKVTKENNPYEIRSRE